MAISEGSLSNLKDFFAQICLCEASQDNVRKIEIYFQIEIFGQESGLENEIQKNRFIPTWAI